MNIKQILTASIIVILLLVIIGQGIVFNLSLRNAYSNLAGQAAAIKYEVKDLHAVTGQELTETRRAAELTRTDNATQEAYTQRRIKALNDALTGQRKAVGELAVQSKEMQEFIAGFNDQLTKFDDQLYRLDEQAKAERQAAVESEEAAYKTLYIVCLLAAGGRDTAAKVQEGCRETVKSFLDDNLHQEPALGWVWPLVGVGEMAG